MIEKRKTLVAEVLSRKMQKTAIVQVTSAARDPLFKKYYTKHKKFKVHDEKNETATGDRVLIRESKPISREKRWVVIKILEKAAA